MGLELGLFDQLKFQLDYFYEKRTGIYIQQESVPSIVGLNETQYVNLGEMKNQGFDGSMEYEQRFYDWYVTLPVPISLTIEIKSCMMINRLLYGPTKVKLDLPIVSNAVL
ncbi:TonB-dependent receptor [Bacteroides thetaiotaomicron]|nr:TonB-dependent receptor [Bacteroides thetaiotaomicron]